MLILSRLRTGPWWVWSLIMGVYFGVFTTLFDRLIDPGSDDSIGSLVVGGVFGGIVFGLVMGRLAFRANAEDLAATGLDDPAAQRAASLAADGGPIPADPEVRRAAAQLANRRLSKLEDRRVYRLIFLGLLTIAAVAGAVFSSLWWIVFAAFFGYGLAQSLIRPSRMERRIDELMFPEEQLDDVSPE